MTDRTRRLRYLSLGAGVQSTTLALMIAHGEIEPVDCAIFADTQWEPAEVYTHLAWLEALIPTLPHPFPIYRVTAGSLRDHVLAGVRVEDSDPQFGVDVYRGIPAYVRPGANGRDLGMIRRQCTREYKIAPITRKVREILGIAPGAPVQPRGATVRQPRSDEDMAHDRQRATNGADAHFLVGPRRVGTWDEADAAVRSVWPAARASGSIRSWTWRDDVSGLVAEAWEGRRTDGQWWFRVLSPPAVLVEQLTGISSDEADRAKPSQEAWMVRLYPLLDRRISRMGCIAWMRAHGYPDPPRSSCIGCPLHTRAEWRRMRADDPASFADAVEVDEAIRGGLVGGIRAREVYLHSTGRPLVDAVVDNSAQLAFDATDRPMANECEGMCGV